ncbi:MAG TPA: hypothetical protein VHT96_02085 [Clostridia bacterium]|nr:hypothetical protein [Clostridia bacterium]
MESPMNIENITNSLLVLQKIKQLRSSAQRGENAGVEGAVHPDRLSLMLEILSVIEGFLPQTRGGSLALALRQGTRYSGAYRELKGHIRNISRSKLEMQHVMKTLKLVVPVLDNRQRVYLDKFIKIVEIIES